MQLVKKFLKCINDPCLVAKAGLVLIVYSSALVQAQENQGFLVDKIVAKVDNYIVLKSEVDRAYLEYVANGGTASEFARCQYLAMLIRNKLMMARAEIDSIVVSEAEVNENTERRINMILAQYGGSPEELEKKFEKSFDQIKLELHDQVHEQLVVNEMEQTITKDLTVTPAEVRKFYNRIPKDSLPFFSAEAEIAQIVRVAKVSDEQKEETKRQLLALRDRILAGEDFGQLAKTYSADPSVTGNSGNMGWVGRGRLVPPYEAMAFKLRVNEISMPVETEYGFHIIQLLGRRGNEYNTRHILMAPTPSQSDIDDAGRFLDSLRNLVLKGDYTFQKAAKEFSDDVMTKGNGGFFTDDLGGTRISADDIDPVIFFAIDTMKVGDISKPLAYRTDDGKQGMRILFYKSKISPHVASLEQDWNRIQAATLNVKKQQTLEKWFDKARRDVFINIDPAYKYCGILDD